MFTSHDRGISHCLVVQHPCSRRRSDAVEVVGDRDRRALVDKVEEEEVGVPAVPRRARLGVREEVAGARGRVGRPRVRAVWDVDPEDLVVEVVVDQAAQGL